MTKELASALLLLATVVAVVSTAIIINSGVVYHEVHYSQVDASSRELNRLPIRGR